MTIHAIYSLVSMYITWFYSTIEIKKRIEEARTKTSLKSNINDDDAKLEAMAQAVGIFMFYIDLCLFIYDLLFID